MKIYELTNGVISAKVRTQGAELISLRKNSTGQEYMWSGNPEYWSRVSPVLFPFVGKLKEQQYTYKGTIYQPKPHGFARDMCFDVVESETEPLNTTFFCPQQVALARHRVMQEIRNFLYCISCKS